MEERARARLDRDRRARGAGRPRAGLPRRSAWWSSSTAASSRRARSWRPSPSSCRSCARPARPRSASASPARPRPASSRGALAIDHGRAAEHALGDSLRARRDGERLDPRGRALATCSTATVADEIAVAARVDAGDGVGPVRGSAGRRRRRSAWSRSTRAARSPTCASTACASSPSACSARPARARARSAARSSARRSPRRSSASAPARRLLELTVEHAKSRRQFDQPIGAFQAIQHKCADMFVQVEKARATGLLRDDGRGRGRPAPHASARRWRRRRRATASASSARRASRSTAAWATPGRATCSSSSSAPRRSRRCSARVAQHRRRIADLLGDLTCSSTTTPTTEKFRSELRAWLAANQPTLEEMRAEPATSSAHLTGWSRRWQRKLFDAGLLVPGWPPELGGRNLPPVQQLVYHEEMAKIPVKRTTNPQGLGIIAPSILDYGSEFLKQKYLRAHAARRDRLVPGDERARRGQRPRRALDARRGARRPLRGERPEDLDLGRAPRRPLLLLRAHRSRCAQAPRHQRADHRHEGAGHHACARCPS